MDKEIKQSPVKEYTILREKLNLNDGFNMTNSVMFTLACHVYARESPKYREVLVTNISKPIEEGKKERYTANGTSPMSLMVLEASKGSLLEIQVEGIDDSAKKFRDELKRGLNEEEYLRTEFYPRFQAIKRVDTDMTDLRPLYKRNYKENSI